MFCTYGDGYLYVIDFNFEHDVYSVELLLASGVPLIFAGGEVSKNSMWLFRKDLNDLKNYVSNNENLKGTLIDKLSKRSYQARLFVWAAMGLHLSPWNKNNPYTYPTGHINGYVTSLSLVRVYSICMYYILMII